MIVFDLDGTLVDSRRDLADAVNALIAERGASPLSEEAVGDMIGEGAATLVRRALTAAGLAVEEASLPRFLALYDERLLHTTRPYAGIPRALQALARVAPLAVLTNKPLAPSLRLLEALDLSLFFRDVIGGDGPWPRKPDPASLRALMARHGAEPSRTVLVGDSPIDAKTARAAGARICLARYGFGYVHVQEPHLHGDEAIVDHPEAIPAAIAGLLDLAPASSRAGTRHI